MFEWLFKSRTEDISNVLEIIAKDLTKVQLAVMAQEKAAGMIAKALDITWAAVPGKTAIWLFPTYYVRELYGVLYEWIF